MLDGQDEKIYAHFLGKPHIVDKYAPNSENISNILHTFRMKRGNYTCQSATFLHETVHFQTISGCSIYTRKISSKNRSFQAITWYMCTDFFLHPADSDQTYARSRVFWIVCFKMEVFWEKDSCDVSERNHDWLNTAHTMLVFTDGCRRSYLPVKVFRMQR